MKFGNWITSDHISLKWLIKLKDSSVCLTERQPEILHLILCVVWNKLYELTVNVQVNWTLERCVIGALWCDVTLLQHFCSLFVQYILKIAVTVILTEIKITETETQKYNCNWKITTKITLHPMRTKAPYLFGFNKRLACCLHI